MTQNPSSTLRARWLTAMLPHVPFDGWTETAAWKAADEAGLSEGEQKLAAPNGLIDLVDAFFDAAETTAKAQFTEDALDGLGVREKVLFGVRAWLEALAPNREAARKASARGFLPWVAGDAVQRTWSVADVIWTGIGDTSEDYNKYSKRGLLAATIPLIFLRWLDEDDDEALDAYISQRLTGAMKFGQTAGKVAKPMLDAIEKIRTR
ncbi:MAG: COQ9 family protein [Hyphomonadaceae bacterium]